MKKKTSKKAIKPPSKKVMQAISDWMQNAIENDLADRREHGGFSSEPLPTLEESYKIRDGLKGKQRRLMTRLINRAIKQGRYAVKGI